MNPHALTTAELAVLDAARTLARAKAEVDAAMDAWMAAPAGACDVICGVEWDRLAAARRDRNEAADRLYDIVSTELAVSAANDVPEFLRSRLPMANGSART